MGAVDPSLVQLELIEGADHSYKGRGGRAAEERNVTQMINAAVEWCRSTLGATDYVHDDNNEETLEPAARRVGAKRERPDEPLETSPSKRTKATNTLEGYFTKKAN